MRRRILFYMPDAGIPGPDLASAVARRSPATECVVVRRGQGDSPRPQARVAVIDLPAAPAEGRDLTLRVLSDIAPDLQPDAVVVAGAPLGSRGELAPALAAMSEMSRPPERFLVLTAHGLKALGDRADGRALRALLAWYDHVLVLGESEDCDAHAPPALRDAGRVGLSYVGELSSPDTLDRAADRLVSSGRFAKIL